MQQGVTDRQPKILGRGEPVSGDMMGSPGQASLWLLRAGFIISQGQGSQHRRQSHGVRRQTAGPSLAFCPSALPWGWGAQGQAPSLAGAEGRPSAPEPRDAHQPCFQEALTWEIPASPPTPGGTSLTEVPAPLICTPGPQGRNSVLNSPSHFHTATL